MKNKLKIMLIVLFSIFIGIITGYHIPKEQLALEKIVITDTIFVKEVELTLDDHISNIIPDKLQSVCKGIIMVESGGNPSVISADGEYVGILQLGRLYVRECNRIQDSITFTYDDRLDSIKSLQMFAIFQNKHNPTHDVDRAIHLHNPTAGSGYSKRVKSKMK